MSGNKPVPPGLPESPGLSVSQADLDEFLVALETFDPPESEETAPNDEPPQAQPRRMKQLARGTLQPAATLDLHGLTREEALPRVRNFLDHAARQRWAVVVIVTGRGLHSQEGPVLRQAVEKWLATARELVVEWGIAPRRHGGAGALAVFPRAWAEIETRP